MIRETRERVRIRSEHHRILHESDLMNQRIDPSRFQCQDETEVKYILCDRPLPLFSALKEWNSAIFRPSFSQRLPSLVSTQAVSNETGALPPSLQEVRGTAARECSVTLFTLLAGCRKGRTDDPFVVPVMAHRPELNGTNVVARWFVYIMIAYKIDSQTAIMSSPWSFWKEQSD